MFFKKENQKLSLLLIIDFRLIIIDFLTGGKINKRLQHLLNQGWPYFHGRRDIEKHRIPGICNARSYQITSCAHLATYYHSHETALPIFNDNI